MRLRTLIARVTSLALLVSIGGCSKSSPPLPSIIILSLDTLRADHLSGYGYPRPTSPALDALARGAVTFPEVRCQATGTLTSHLSLLTSLYPRHFRITRADGRNVDGVTTELRLPDEVLTLAEVLRENGYETAAFTGGGFMSARWGAGQGFDRYEETRTRFDGFRATFRRLQPFLKERRTRAAEGPASPLFLFVHTFEVHEPYWAPGSLGRRFSRETFEELTERVGYRPVPSELNGKLEALPPGMADEVVNLYDNGLHFTDMMLEAFFEMLRELELLEKAIVVVLSDHGDEFLEHGRFNHGRTIYEELVRVPLILHLPDGRGAGRVVDHPVALLDVAPTVLDVAGIPVPEQFRGRSLVPLFQGEGDAGFRERPLLLDAPHKSEDVRGLVQGDWKLIISGENEDPQLHDLRADPNEARNLVSERPSVRDRLAAELRRQEEAAVREADANGWTARADSGTGTLLDEGLRQQLRALGYTD